MRPSRPTVRELTRRARKARRAFLGRHDRWMWEGKYLRDFTRGAFGFPPEMVRIDFNGAKPLR